VKAIEMSDIVNVSREVIGKADIMFDENDTARDVPQWDSLNHTLIILDINERYGIELSPYDAAKAKNFGELLTLIRQAISAACR
jgi:acyl carrier protein